MFYIQFWRITASRTEEIDNTTLYRFVHNAPTPNDPSFLIQISTLGTSFHEVVVVFVSKEGVL